ncbi:MAG: hypothetical protein ACEPOV_12760 [Hyphomicrobiales bacterium]
MKTKYFFRGNRITFSFLIMAFAISFVSCKKDVELIKPTNNSQQKAEEASFKDLHFNPFTILDGTKNAGVAINKKNDVVRTYFVSGKLVYQAGTIKDNQLIWNSSTTDTPISKNSEVINSSVAINNNRIVAVNRIIDWNTWNNKLYLTIGDLDNQTINLKNTIYVEEEGAYPKVAINDNGSIIIVYTIKGTNFYRIVNYDPATNSIKLGDKCVYSGGTQPSIAINNNNQVVEVHVSKDSYGAGYLWSRTGTLNESSIKWDSQDPASAEVGENPDVALLDNGYVILVHDSKSNISVGSRVGEISNGQVEWFRYRVDFASERNYCHDAKISANENNFISSFSFGDPTQAKIGIGQIK